MIMTKELSKEDVALINDTWGARDVQTITKDGSGHVIHAGRKSIEQGALIRDFRGRILKHDMHVIPKGGEQILIGVKGVRFEDIPLDKRQLAFWVETDFE